MVHRKPVNTEQLWCALFRMCACVHQHHMHIVHYSEGSIRLPQFIQREGESYIATLRVSAVHKPRSNLWSSKHGNPYHHANWKCVECKWGTNFNVVIPDTMTLSASERGNLRQEFGI